MKSVNNKIELRQVQSNYKTLKGVANELHGWTIQEHGDKGISVVRPKAPPPQSGQVVPNSK